MNPPPALSPGRRRAVLAAMCLALVLVVAGVSMLNVILPALTRDLGASSTEQLWIVDAYAITLAALLLPFGAIGDRFGRRGALLVGIGLFGVASALSAMATSPGPLIAWRALAGIGAALIMPGTLSTITSVFPADQRARAVGVWAGFAGAGGTLGMLASGAMAERFWWGSVFVLSAAIAAVAFVATVVAVPDSRDPEEAHLDPVGSVLSVAGFGLLVLGIIEGPHRGWTDGLTLLGLIGGGVALTAWVLWSLRTPRPLLDPRLFGLRGFATGSASLFLQFFAMFGFFLVALQYLQLVLGYSTFTAALALMPMAAMMLPLSALAPIVVERLGHRTVAGGGLAVAAAGFVVVSTMDAGSSYLHFLAAMLLVGAGMALAMTPATNAIVASLPLAKQGVASAVNDTARELGAAMGVAVLGSALSSGYRDRIADTAATLPPEAAEVAREAPAGAMAVAGELGAAGQGLADAAREAFMSGQRTAVLLGAAALFGGALYTWLRAPARLDPVPAPADLVLAATSGAGG